MEEIKTIPATKMAVGIVARVAKVALTRKSRSVLEKSLVPGKVVRASQNQFCGDFARDTMGENLQTKVGSQITLGNSLPILCPVFMESFCQSRSLLIGELPGLNVGILSKPKFVERASSGSAKSHFV